MFTGIIESLSPARALPATSQPATASSLVLEARVDASTWRGLALGESIAVNGVCLTIAELPESERVRFFVSPETLARTSLGSLSECETFVHLERAMPANGRFSGHWVQGHVDGLAQWLGATESGGAYLARFALAPALLKYCVEKGSIALDGVSLTVNRVEKSGPGATSGEIHITLIPHTWEHTRFSKLRPGDRVNVEVDVLAKYVENFLLASKGGRA